MHDRFIIPTIRYNGNTLSIKFLTIEWLSWYFGIKWEWVKLGVRYETLYFNN